MHKLALELDQLVVESFATAPAARPAGTVRGHGVSETPTECLTACGSCTICPVCISEAGSCVPAESCANTCGDTCGCPTYFGDSCDQLTCSLC
jgi:hypothetical protein